MKLIIEIDSLDSMQLIKNNNSVEEKNESIKRMVNDLNQMFSNVKKTLNYNSYSKNDKIDIWVEEKGICSYLIKGINK
tara:strand:+ start:372 stop:605 length:234 start_codon:yes stop_codon:yes gene_type:complete